MFCICSLFVWQNAKQVLHELFANVERNVLIFKFQEMPALYAE